MKILIIEDDTDVSGLISSSIKTIYSEEDIDITFANNGVEGSSKMIHSNFDLILLDLHMPIMNGLEFLTHNKDALTKTPIIVITATPEIAEKSIKDNIRIIAKPFSINDFSSAINEALNR